MSTTLGSPTSVASPRAAGRGRERRCDVAIIGCGPYGLSANAALRDSGLDVQMFGSPMSFWHSCMPKGMLMKSPWAATSFAPPGSGLTLDDYERTLTAPLPRPLPLTQFLQYGEWFRQQTEPVVDERRVQRLRAFGSAFELRLADGARVEARRVVVAAGIAPFGRRPPVFAGLPEQLACHSTELTDPEALAGARVAVLGAGQSGLESAALLHEASAEVQVLVREPRVHWLSRSHRLHALGPLAKLMYAPSDIGPAGISRLVSLPRTFACIPRGLRERLDRRALRAAGTAWLAPRLREVPIRTGVEVLSAHPDRGGLSLGLSSGERVSVDRVVMGTGFQVDVRRYDFLAPELVERLRCVHGYPVLSRQFQSSAPGLYFIGAPAAGTFGPLLRFVAGAAFAATVLGHHLRGEASAGQTRRGAASDPA